MSNMESAWDNLCDASYHEENEWYTLRHELEAKGWTCVEITKRTFKDMQEVAQWLRENCKGEFDHKLTAGQFLFANARDAAWFSLKWL